MTKLTSNQLKIIAAAANRKDGAILPLPDTVPNKGSAPKMILASLVKRGLAAERGKSKKLLLTDAGRAAVAKAGRPSVPAFELPPAAAIRAAASRPNSKKAKLVALLARPKGAAMRDLTRATGWQSHSVRAALSGLRKSGIGIVRVKDTRGETVYRVAGNQG
jgi:hypothetical protein